ncbi:MAG: hypothetical protein KIH01_05610 [Candidatus Freyarchaeota archaeon]|nr:hypothetical protein [Candidatus Jordarchaeia archaeon]
MPRRKSKRVRAERRARKYILLGALLLIISPFIPNIYVGFTWREGFPLLTGGIDFWINMFGVMALVMGVMVLVGYLVSERGLSIVLVVLGGIIGLILGVIGVFSTLPGLPFGPAAAFIGGLLAVVGALIK